MTVHDELVRQAQRGDTEAFVALARMVGDRCLAIEARNAQGAGQVDELWILDVAGRIVILDAAYGPAVPAQLVDEMRALAASATFEVP